MINKDNEDFIKDIEIKIRHLIDQKEFYEGEDPLFLEKFFENENKFTEDFINLYLFNYIIDHFNLLSKNRFEELLKSLESKYRVHLAKITWENFNIMPKKERQWLLMRLSRDNNEEIRKKAINIVKNHFNFI